MPSRININSILEMLIVQKRTLTSTTVEFWRINIKAIKISTITAINLYLISSLKININRCPWIFRDIILPQTDEISQFWLKNLHQDPNTVASPKYLWILHKLKLFKFAFNIIFFCLYHYIRNQINITPHIFIKCSTACWKKKVPTVILLL